MMTTLVILDGVENIPVTLPSMSDSGSAILLTLSPDEQITNYVERYLAQQYAQVRVLSAARWLDEVALQVKEKYSRLVAEAPDKIKVGDKTLREALTFEGNFSLWWINEIFGKRSDRYPTFSRLCQLEAIRTIVDSSKVTDFYLISQDANFWKVIASYCQHANILLRSPSPSRPRQWLPSLSPARIFSSSRSCLVQMLAASLAWFLMTGIQTFIARRIARYEPVDELSRMPVCAFHTIYPRLWRVGGNSWDEKYGKAPHIIRASGKIQSVYACTFSADGFHQIVGPRRFLRLCRWLQARWEKREEQEVPIFLLDAYLSWGDFLRTFAQAFLILWRYRQLEKSVAFQTYWQYKGINFAPLLKQELSVAMVRTPRYLLHALRVRRFIRQMMPDELVYCHFEYGLGRAIAYGARSAETRTSLVGTQDGPMSKRRLANYHYPGELPINPTKTNDFILQPPLPDYYLLEGTGALERMKEAGYPPERLYVGGAPRVSGMLQTPRRSDASKSKQSLSDRRGQKTVLVAFGASDSVAILAACLPVLHSRADYHFIFKLHPRGGSAQQIEIQLTGHTLAGTYTIETGDIYRLIPLADVIVATYSSVALEAAALGYPVVCLHLPNRVNTTPLLDIDTPAVRFVANAKELMVALDQVTTVPVEDETQTQKIEEYCFYRLDGHSAERWAEKIIEIAEANKQH